VKHRVQVSATIADDRKTVIGVSSLDKSGKDDTTGRNAQKNQRIDVIGAKDHGEKRTVHPQFPPKVEYELTEFGKTLCAAMKTLVDWAMTFPKTRETSRYQPRKARKAF
jgi:hypothetical protein